jgi:WS/DGAT/MGAT family acyltransferase
MHVAATMLFDAEPVQLPSGGVDVERIREYVLSRLDQIPRYRQRLAEVPLDAQPIWVDDEHFNIHYHVRHASLPRPGTERQLKRLSGRIFSQQLDRTKPLWELWIVEGLDEDKRFALINKVHHSVVDGVAGVDLMTYLLTPEPRSEVGEVPRFRPRRAPSATQLLRDQALYRATTPLRFLRSLARPGEQIQEAADRLSEGARALSEFLGVSLQRASATPLNTAIGPHRKFDWLRIDLGRVKEVKNRLGGTVNDVVLATVAGAVRRFLEHRRVPIDALRFRVFAPVSVRSEEDQGSLGNRVSGWYVDLPIDDPDPRVRLERIRATTARLKESHHALGADVLTGVSEWTGPTLLSVAFQLATRIRPFNLIVTNVPGPQIPLYLLESQMLATYPQAPLLPNQGLAIAQFSYAGWLCWGFTADWDLMPDLHDIVLATEKAFEELESAAGGTETKKKPRQRRASPSVRSPGPPAHA